MTFKQSKKNNLFTLAAMLCLICFASACNDNFDATTELNGNRSDVRSMLQQDIKTQTETISVDDFNFVSDAGVILSADPDAFVFTDDGTAVSGDIDFEYIELLTISDQVKYGFWTIVIDTEEILETDGEFYFAASQDGRTINLKPGGVLNVQVPNTNPNPEMQLFSAAESSWTPILADAMLLNINDEGYEFKLTRLEWVNIDYFSKFDEPITTIEIDLPEGYTTDNTNCILVFKNLDIIIPFWGDPFDIQAPINEDVTIFAIAAEDSETFRMDSAEVTTEVGQIISLNPKSKSVKNILQAIEDLD